MRRITTLFALALLTTAPALADKARTPPPVARAETYPMHDAHPAEKVTIAAEPCDTKDLAPKTRLDYLHHGFLPIRIIVTNDSDAVITLDDARIQFVAGDNTVLPAATGDELQRRLFSRKSAEGTKIPLIPITIHHEPVDKQILSDDFDFGFRSTTIEPHTTAAGYLYYDTRDLDEPVLNHATLEVRRVHPVNTKQEFYSFEIPLKPTPDTVKASVKPDAKPDDKAPSDKAPRKPTE